MNILITGAKGFVGRNLVENLKTLQDKRNKTRPNLKVDEIYEFDLDNDPADLDKYCSKADFVLNLAGVNRPKDPEEFRKGNFGFASTLLDTLKLHENTCPVMLASSVQATLAGRFGTSEYGLSKRDGEKLFFKYAEETGAEVLVYRFPNLVGKWVRPNYNSAVGTFCYNIANDLPITVNDPSVELDLLFIDDLIEEMYDALENKPHRCDYPSEGAVVCGVTYDGLTPRWVPSGQYCGCPVTYKATLGEIVSLLKTFHDQPSTLTMPSIPAGSFEKKLYSMYLSYLPESKVAVPLKMNVDERGSFTEILKTIDHGQFSVNISKPGITKGQHWHNSKWELFIVVSGHGLIQERKIGTDPTTGEPYEPIQFEVSGENITAVHMLPGYTHNIINLSDTAELVTLMWANEMLDPEKPDTYYEKV
ncbi:MAG: NAD-dependent epimerase/dehydratase family protein [Eubacterium sp.]|nr:NAD-dependent epimerase/dehydratase family protein [Eubacterium sp.]